MIAVEKAGIIKPGATAVLAEQRPGPAEVLLRRCAEVEVTPVREGLEFGVASRVPAVGGQLLSLQGLRARYDDVFLPLYGAHQAQNAVVALAAVEAFVGDEPLDDDVVREAFARATSPGRLEIIRRSPMILLDAAHNPHGAEAMAAALEDSFAFSPLIGVVGVMADKDVEGVLAALEPHLAHVVCTQNSTERAMPAADLAVVAREVFGPDRVSIAPRLADAIDEAHGARRGRRGARDLDRVGCGARHRVGDHRRRGPDAAPAPGERLVSDVRQERSPKRGHVRGDPLPRGRRARPDHPGDDQPGARPLADRRLDRARALRRVPAAGRAAAVGGGVPRRVGDPGRRDRAWASWCR